jgi:hypothetical protein
VKRERVRTAAVDYLYLLSRIVSRANCYPDLLASEEGVTG